ncbi:hypothetical protein [Paraburkholderia rhizosphaerae]|uniref:hypothetical protein n=1 Tax=Paraburkholderia rhizosphaerae TaxID=480658 RepID=UPI0010658E2C|nr:hypothetical protein [Paraburkholderia rhizosphaerae]
MTSDIITCNIAIWIIAGIIAVAALVPAAVAAPAIGPKDMLELLPVEKSRQLIAVQRCGADRAIACICGRTLYCSLQVL